MIGIGFHFSILPRVIICQIFSTAWVVGFGCKAKENNHYSHKKINMQLLLSASLFLLIVGMATATPGPTMDQLIVVQASPTPGASTWEGFVPSTTMLTDPVSSPTQAPTSYLVLREAVAPVVAPVPVLDDAPASLPAIVPIRPPILPSTLSPTADLVSSPTMEPTITSEFPSLVPSFSSLPTIEPSVAPAEDPTKRPTSGNFISSVKVIGLEMSLRNAGTLLETNRWQVETEKFYNEYFEDIICVVSFVKSQASDLNDPRVNTITYDLLLQSEFMRITDSTRYALAPFQDPAANIQYGNALRKLINFERLSLPIPVPKAPKRTDVGSEEKRYIYGKLGMHALLGIVAAGLFGVFIAVYGYNRASRQRRLSKPSTEPTSTFRISSDDDISTIGPADDCMDSEKGERYVPDFHLKKFTANFLTKVAFVIK